MARPRLLAAVAALLAAAALAWLALGTGARGGSTGPHAGGGAGEDGAPVAEAPGLASSPTAPPPATPAAAPAPRWWVERRVVGASPGARTARLEAWWWKEAPPLGRYENPDRVFTSGDLEGSADGARVRIDGEGDGTVVLFLVEGGRRRLASPFRGDPRDHVTPGLGTSTDEEVTAGLRDLALVARDRDEKPVPGLWVQAADPAKAGRVQGARTDEAGRVRFSGFPGPTATVSWRSETSVTTRPERTVGLVPEFAAGEPRAVEVLEEEVALKVARNPWVRLRVVVAGAPPDAWCPVRLVTIQGAPGAGTVFESSLGFALPPGRWRGSAQALPGGAIPFETPDLALDAEATVEIPASVPATTAWLDVAFDVGRSADAAGLASAVEAKNRYPVRPDVPPSWAGTHAAAPHERVLLFPTYDQLEVTAAIRVGGRVRFSEPRVVSLAPGQRLSLVLPTAPAGGIRVPPTPPQTWSLPWDLVERRLPATGPVEDATFRFTWTGSRTRATTWWVPPGRYTLQRRADESVPPTVVRFVDVRPDVVFDVEEPDPPEGGR